MDINKICIGIDFGTSNSCLSIWLNNNPIIIKDTENSNVIPTIIEFKDDKKIVGNDAYTRKEIFDKMDIETNIIYEIKRFIGKKYSELNLNELDFLGYKITSDENDNILINNKYYPEEIVTHIFMSFHSIICNHFNFEGTINCVISVPARYNDLQRNTIKHCATISNFNVLRLINEPTAAALCYGINNPSVEKTICVFDLGGGTLDINLLKIYGSNYEVVGVSGNSALGGTNFDKKIMEYCIEEFLKNNNILNDETQMNDFVNNIDPANLQKLKYLSEKAKISLSDNDKTKIVIQNFYGNYKMDILITRNIFTLITKDLISLLIKPINELLNICDMQKQEIDEIIMVGGMTKMPLVLNSVELFFGKELNCAIDPDTVVSIGASILGNQLLNKTTMENNLLIIDRTSLSIGVEISGGIMDVIIPRGSIIPIKKSKKYTTDTDFMEEIKIKIYEGERKMTCDNFLIGDFVLSGIEKEKRGLPEIKIEFSIDHNGIIKIKAEDIKNTLNKKTILISQNKQNLDKDEINKIIEKAKILDTQDRIEKSKKQYYLKLLDFSHKIIDNIINEKLNIDDTQKQEVLKNIQEIHIWIKSKQYNEIDLDKYKELINIFNQNYAIFLVHNNVSENKVEGKEENISGVKIYEDEPNFIKYDKQIEYFKTILNEYREHNLEIIKLYSKNFYNENIYSKQFIIDTLNKKCNFIINFIEDLLVKLITETTNDDEIQQYCNEIYCKDTDYKNQYFIFCPYFDLIYKLENLLEQKENEILNNNENENNEITETLLTNNEIIDENNDETLNLIIEYYAILHKIKNGHLEFNENELLKMIKTIELL